MLPQPTAQDLIAMDYFAGGRTIQHAFSCSLTFNAVITYNTYADTVAHVTSYGHAETSIHIQHTDMHVHTFQQLQ